LTQLKALKVLRHFAALPTLLAAIFALQGGTAAAETLSHGRFKDVTIYHPPGPVKQVVLFLSGDGGWDDGPVRMAKVLANQGGAMVIGIDSKRFFGDLERDGGKCVFPDGDLENLSHFVQAYYRLPTYIVPVLAGYSAGASLAYAVAAQAPAGIFAGVLTLGFSPDLELAKPLCKGEGVHFKRSADGKVMRLLPVGRLSFPWVNLTGDRDDICPAADAQRFIARTPGAQMVLLHNVDHGFEDKRRWERELIAALGKVSAASVATLPPPPPDLADVPVVEVPATGGSDSNLFAVLLSGDGGWAGIDKELARALAAHGMPVAGIDSLRYFWTPRTPEGLAHDVDRTLRYYGAHWRKSRALLIGYSQGADVLPFAVNRLPPSTRAALALTVLIGIGPDAAFEFHVANWIGRAGGLPTRPETDKLVAATTLCLYGRDDSESVCPQLGAAHARVIQLPGGHHFGGDYDGLATLILQQAGVSRAAAAPAAR
jgi:type IV secretory pathway VirJ component